MDGFGALARLARDWRELHLGQRRTGGSAKSASITAQPGAVPAAHRRTVAASARSIACGGGPDFGLVVDWRAPDIYKREYRRHVADFLHA